MKILLNRIYSALVIPAIFFCGPILISCASNQTDANTVEKDFGKSVQRMRDAQIYDLQDALTPIEVPPLELDGAAADIRMQNYREKLIQKEK